MILSRKNPSDDKIALNLSRNAGDQGLVRGESGQETVTVCLNRFSLGCGYACKAEKQRDGAGRGREGLRVDTVDTVDTGVPWPWRALRTCALLASPGGGLRRLGEASLVPRAGQEAGRGQPGPPRWPTAGPGRASRQRSSLPSCLTLFPQPSDWPVSVA